MNSKGNMYITVYIIDYIHDSIFAGSIMLRIIHIQYPVQQKYDITYSI